MKTAQELPDTSPLTYKPKRFSDLAETELGLSLWRFLNERDNVLRMITASELGQPAVAALVHGLLAEFGDAVQHDRVKRMIGHMVRQVMWRHFFVLDSSNARVRVPGLFSRGSKYIRYQPPAGAGPGGIR